MTTVTLGVTGSNPDRSLFTIILGIIKYFLDGDLQL